VRPYYEHGGVALFHGDCRELLPQLTGGVGAVVTDPPYGETALAWDRWPAGWPALVRPLLAPSGSLWCFGSLRMFLEQAADFAGWRFAQDVVWEKQNGSGFHADRFKRVHEVAAHFYPEGARWEALHKDPPVTLDAVARKVTRRLGPAHTGKVGGHLYESEDGGPRLMRSVLQVRNCHGHAEHPTQKPEGIVLPLVRYSCPPGGLVLDPFAGSGTTLVVAKSLGRRAIGIEADERHCETAARRLSQQMPLEVA
jgi:site-specific DNA-methyltransferase (adenine-specific)